MFIVHCSIVICLIERAAPLPAVGRTREIHHAQSMLFGNPARLADYDHTITRLERVPIYTLAAQESASTPLDIPYLHRPFFIGSFHVQERVWIAEEKIERPSLRSFESDLPNTSRRKNGERRPNPRKGRIQWQERTLHKQNVSYWFSPPADCTKRQMWGPNQKSLSLWKWGHLAASDGRFLSR